jgi:hypothetical protein
MNRRPRVGRLTITLVAIFTGTAAYLADWNETHIYNPNWPPHAKFHNAQTMVMASASALLSLWFLWRRGENALLRLNVSSIFACFYWMCLLPSILFPGAAFYDPDFGGYHAMPSVLGFELNQAYGAAFFIVLVAGANWLERSTLEASRGSGTFGDGR